MRYVLRTTSLSPNHLFFLDTYLLRHPDRLSHLMFTGQPLCFPETREPELSTNP